MCYNHKQLNIWSFISTEKCKNLQQSWEPAWFKMNEISLSLNLSNSPPTDFTRFLISRISLMTCKKRSTWKPGLDIKPHYSVNYQKPSKQGWAICKKMSKDIRDVFTQRQLHTHDDDCFTAILDLQDFCINVMKYLCNVCNSLNYSFPSGCSI